MSPSTALSVLMLCLKQCHKLSKYIVHGLQFQKIQMRMKFWLFLGTAWPLDFTVFVNDKSHQSLQVSFH